MAEIRKSERIAEAWFHWFGMAGLILSIAVFVLYAFGAVPAAVAPEDSAAAWHLSSGEYREAMGLECEAGWMFRTLDAYGLSTAALALLASVALPTLLALSVSWLRRRVWIYAAMALFISGVLIVAILR